MRRLDRCWFRVLAAVNGWTVRHARAHCRREALRQLRRHLECQKPQLN
jgi:hypothetical protein